MSTVYTDTVKTLSPNQDLTIGTTGQTVTLPGNDLRVNTVKDKGGNTLWTSDGAGNLSSVNSGLKGNLLLLSTQTASSSASIEFTSGIDSTYDVYIFKFIDINAAASDPHFSFQVNASGQTGFNETITSTVFRAYHNEADSTATLSYSTGQDQQQGTAYQCIARNVSSGADECAAGELHLFNPSSTVYVKHFDARTSGNAAYEMDTFAAGYINTTSAITEISFKVDSGNFDGTIKMYGLL